MFVSLYLLIIIEQNFPHAFVSILKAALVPDFHAKIFEGMGKKFSFVYGLK